MASKKYSLLAGIICLFASAGFAQTTGYDAADSSVVPTSRMPQHTEFLNGTYNYPAKPRNMWEVGIKGGHFALSSDVASRPGYGFGAHIRKAFGYVFSARLQYMYASGRGLNWVPSGNYSANDAWNGYTGNVFYN